MSSWRPSAPNYPQRTTQLDGEQQPRPSLPTRDFHHASGPRLPPLQIPLPSARPGHYPPTTNPLSLPPMQVPALTESPSWTTALPISHLLSSTPISPRRKPLPPQPPAPRRSPPRGYEASLIEGRTRADTNSSYYSRQHPPFPREPHIWHPAESPLESARPAPPYPDSARRAVEALRSGPPSAAGSVISEPTARPYFSPAISSFSQFENTRSEPDADTSCWPPKPAFVRPPANLRYQLSIRQQPVAARACGFGERDRRVVDPPPILELNITDPESGHPEQDLSAMLALHCTLLSEDGCDDETEVPSVHPDTASTRRLMGSLVASPYQAKDEHGVAGTFFVFPDLSCRSPGKYRLHFQLLRVDPTMMTVGSTHSSVGNIVSEIFSVFTAKDFPGMKASTPLLKALRKQGLNVGVKKGSGNRIKRGKQAKQDSSSEEESDSEDEEGGSAGSGTSPKVKRKKHKRTRRES